MRLETRAAALAIEGSPLGEPDSRALARCAAEDRSGSVAARCRTPLVPPARTHAVTIYVLPDLATAPQPERRLPARPPRRRFAPRGETADRRGAVFEPRPRRGSSRCSASPRSDHRRWRALPRANSLLGCPRSHGPSSPSKAARPEGAPVTCWRAPARTAAAPNRAPLPPHVWAAAVGAQHRRAHATDHHREGDHSSSRSGDQRLGERALPPSPRRSSRGSARRPAWRCALLRFNVGTIEPPERDTELRISKVPGPTPLDPQVARAIGRVKDDDLRQTITDAARTKPGVAGVQRVWRGARRP